MEFEVVSKNVFVDLRAPVARNKGILGVTILIWRWTLIRALNQWPNQKLALPKLFPGLDCAFS